MTDGPQVSVLMPCYNAAETVDEAVASILGQSLETLELVAVDDGSTDETLPRLHAWAGRDRRVRLLARRHEGIIASLNAGLAACRAPAIARMDADDRSHPDRLARQLGFLEENEDIAVVGCLVEGYPPGEVREGFRIYLEWLNGLRTPQAIAREIFVESPLAHPSVMMRRTWLARAGVYEDRGWPEDYDLWLRQFLLGARFAKVPEVLLWWREHPRRLTRTDSRYSVENFLRAKAWYLSRGPLQDRDAIIVWGAGPMGRRLSKHLVRQGVPLMAFVDIDPKKVGRTRRGLPILAADDLPTWWGRYARPAVLASVGSRGAREIIRSRLQAMGLREGQDWWAVA